jgi:hypothetical protein
MAGAPDRPRQPPPELTAQIRKNPMRKAAAARQVGQRVDPRHRGPRLSVGLQGGVDVVDIWQKVAPGGRLGGRGVVSPFSIFRRRCQGLQPLPARRSRGGQSDTQIGLGAKLLLRFCPTRGAAPCLGPACLSLAVGLFAQDGQDRIVDGVPCRFGGGRRKCGRRAFLRGGARRRDIRACVSGRACLEPGMPAIRALHVATGLRNRVVGNLVSGIAVWAGQTHQFHPV